MTNGHTTWLLTRALRYCLPLVLMSRQETDHLHANENSTLRKPGETGSPLLISITKDPSQTPTIHKDVVVRQI